MEETVVFHAGENGIPHMRIPAVVVTTRGTVLAFCEAREGGDRTPTDLVMKRSRDGGGTWQAMQTVVAAPGRDAIMNPCPVVDASSGTIFLFVQHFPQGTESHVLPGFVRTWLTTSADDGASWSEPVDLTAQVIDPSTEYGKATGPGVGIQTSGGRLLVPLGFHRTDEDGRIAERVSPMGAVICSDDHGATWYRSGDTPATSTELHVVALADGSLRLDMRNQRPEEKPAHCRYFSISRDGGRTWSPCARDSGLPDVTCQGCMLRYTRQDEGGGKDRILFSSPAAPYRTRANMTVRLSYDEGKHWPVSRTIHAGPSAYSCLTVLPDGRIGLLYEHGEDRPDEKICFARFSLAWLTDGKDRPS